MKLLLYGLILLVSIIIGIYLRNDAGFLHVEYQTWSVEMPLWLSVIMLALTFFITIFLVELLICILRVPSSLNRWLDERVVKKANSATENALVNFFVGNVKQTKKLTQKAASDTSYPIITHILAAEVAQEMQNFDERKKHIAKLKELSENNHDEVELLSAKFDFEANDLTSAELKLENLCKNKNIAVSCYKILIDIYKATNKWDKLKEILPIIKKMQVIHEENYLTLNRLVHKELLKQYVLLQDHDEVFSLWKSLPNKLKADHELLEIYVYFLCRVKEFDMAQKELKYYLKRNLDKNIIFQYANIECEHDECVKEKIGFLEKLLEENVDNPYLLLALGKLCVKEKIWGRAKEYFIASKNVKEIPETYMELAKLFTTLNENETANKYYKEGFLLTSKLYKEKENIFATCSEIIQDQDNSKCNDKE